MRQENYRKLISGRNTGWAANILRLLLKVPSCFYSTIIWLRNLSYSKGWLRTHRANAVVISIGNITTGGTGKTPLVIWLSSFLQQKKIPCAILTRGYKTKKGKFYDEPAILTKNCPDAKIIVNPNRVEGAAYAVNEFAAKAIILDDGFQHRRLHRDLDILTIDATQPFGYGNMLPAGLLREPLSAIERADAAVITRCDQTTQAKLLQLQEKLQLINPNIIIANSIHAPTCAKSMGGDQINIADLRDRTVFAFCGIGNPDAFLRTIRQLAINTAGYKAYDDHHYYTDQDITDIHEEAKYLDADLILTTQKDWTKIALLTSAKKDISFAYLVIELRFISGQDKITQLIERALAGKISKNSEGKK